MLAVSQHDAGYRNITATYPSAVLLHTLALYRMPHRCICYSAVQHDAGNRNIPHRSTAHRTMLVQYGTSQHTVVQYCTSHRCVC
eukprot:3859554-Rhodomonas_salina.2